MQSVTISIDDAHNLVVRALQRGGLGEPVASSVARALVAAQTDGQHGHGLSRVASYLGQLSSGKVKATSRPRLIERSPQAVLIDAGYGFAYPALDLAIETLIERAQSGIIATAAIAHSHHFGQAGAHVERLAQAGLIGLLLGNSPKAMAYWGGTRAMMGTNPIAFGAPVPGGPPLVIDLALAVAARGKIVAANKAGTDIPEGWALDADGKPTTDPAQALAGTLMPVGGAKGAALALMVEIMAAALTGSHFGFEASSFFDGDGPPPDIGCILIAIDPTALSGGAYLARMAVLLGAIEGEQGARLPGTSRLIHRQTARRDGLTLATALHDELLGFAGLRR